MQHLVIPITPFVLKSALSPGNAVHVIKNQLTGLKGELITIKEQICGKTEDAGTHTYGYASRLMGKSRAIECRLRYKSKPN